MKITQSPNFDLKLCMKGLSVLITYIYSDIYEYAYYLTFKRSMKSYASEFNDPWDAPVDAEFLENTGDPYVLNCCMVIDQIIACKVELDLRFGIDQVDNLEEEASKLEADRFMPYFLVYKQSKSYKKMVQFYDRFLTETIEVLYLYACVLTSGKYRVPLVLKRQFKLADEESLRLLNQDDDNVLLLMELIVGLKKHLADLKALGVKKVVKKRPK